MLTEDQLRIINYLNFKVKCLADQEDYGLEVDKMSILKHLETLESQKEPIIKKLKEVMPKVPEYAVRNKPKVTHKKDGTLSAHGEKWFALLRKHKLPVTFDGEIKEITGYKEPNPGSSTQVKEWLFALGWEPCTYKFTRNKETGDEKETPQVRYSTASHPRKGELTDSVVRLKDKEPNIEYLENITTVNHRISTFEGFLNSLRPEFDKPTVVAQAGGFTNTLRFKHRVPVVNLPKVDRPWGNEIRSSIVSGEGKVFLGSDMVSLESTTRDHYVLPLDPEFVEATQRDGYDAHLEIAVVAGLLTKEDYEWYGAYKSRKN